MGTPGSLPHSLSYYAHKSISRTNSERKWTRSWLCQTKPSIQQIRFCNEANVWRLSLYFHHCNCSHTKQRENTKCRHNWYYVCMAQFQRCSRRHCRKNIKVQGEKMQAKIKTTKSHIKHETISERKQQIAGGRLNFVYLLLCSCFASCFKACFLQKVTKTNNHMSVVLGEMAT